MTASPPKVEPAPSPEPDAIAAEAAREVARRWGGWPKDHTPWGEALRGQRRENPYEDGLPEPEFTGEVVVEQPEPAVGVSGARRAKLLPGHERLTPEEIQTGIELVDEIVTRPKTRGECAGMARPCPFVGCRYHLYLDVNEGTGSIKLNHPLTTPDQMEHSCSLDVADRGGVTLDTAGALFNITRERIRQIEARGLRLLGDSARELLTDAVEATGAQE